MTPGAGGEAQSQWPLCMKSRRGRANGVRPVMPPKGHPSRLIVSTALESRDALERLLVSRRTPRPDANSQALRAENLCRRRVLRIAIRGFLGQPKRAETRGLRSLGHMCLLGLRRRIAQWWFCRPQRSTTQRHLYLPPVRSLPRTAARSPVLDPETSAGGRIAVCFAFDRLGFLASRLDRRCPFAITTSLGAVIGNSPKRAGTRVIPG